MSKLALNLSMAALGGVVGLVDVGRRRCQHARSAAAAEWCDWRPFLVTRKVVESTEITSFLEKLINDPAIDDDTLGFHAQQAAEKLLKALLALGGHPSPAATTSVS